jgi:hypothetical protein
VLSVSEASVTGSDMKNCRTCKLLKSAAEFYVNRKAKDRRQSICKICDCAYQKIYREKNRAKMTLKNKIWRENNRERYRETQRRARLRNRDNIRAVQRRWKESNPLKCKAHGLLNKAVLRGEIIKLDKCEWCDNPHEHIHGHHEDYEKPLEVIWLCPICHHNRHEELNG